MRHFSYIYVRRLFFSSSPIRFQSTTTTSVVETSPSDIEKKPTIDHALWATSETNGLINYLSTRIKTAGPITVAEFMREALSNPKYVRDWLSYSLYSYHYSSRVITHDMKYMAKKANFLRHQKLVNCLLRYEIFYY